MPMILDACTPKPQIDIELSNIIGQQDRDFAKLMRSPYIKSIGINLGFIIVRLCTCSNGKRTGPSTIYCMIDPNWGLLSLILMTY